MSVQMHEHEIGCMTLAVIVAVVLFAVSLLCSTALEVAGMLAK